jgi:hypothetical protein
MVVKENRMRKTGDSYFKEFFTEKNQVGGLWGTCANTEILLHVFVLCIHMHKNMKWKREVYF